MKKISFVLIFSCLAAFFVYSQSMAQETAKSKKEKKTKKRKKDKSKPYKVRYKRSAEQVSVRRYDGENKITVRVPTFVSDLAVSTEDGGNAFYSASTDLPIGMVEFKNRKFPNVITIKFKTRRKLQTNMLYEVFAEIELLEPGAYAIEVR
ncbi:hypothetical protein QQ008_06915 [Fulvivirgaceae bacterium BMA10]|uniref:Uncharacterized protein n=1 Tax=Splendidivirga corallicola TaxID=3051826 RepID=A0ABT8KLG9_9BACT|nr:hypothetical protein [Fulvivirgaceae bacterium BMA10]